MSRSVSGKAEGARTMRVPRSPHAARDALSRGRTSPVRSARGAAAAETAAALPVLGALMLVMVWLVSLAATQVLVVDAAREAARSAARGDSEATAISAGGRIAPRSSQFAVRREGDHVVVSVESPVRGPGGLFAFLPLPVARATATAALEDR